MEHKFRAASQILHSSQPVQGPTGRTEPMRFRGDESDKSSMLLGVNSSVLQEMSHTP